MCSGLNFAHRRNVDAAQTLVLLPLSRHLPIVEQEAGSWSDFPQSRQPDDDLRCLLDRLVSLCK
jgi:hypothetical protein